MRLRLPEAALDPIATPIGILLGCPGFQIRRADNVELRQCKVAWGKHRPDYFTHAVEANDTTGVKIIAFSGESAHPDQFKAIFINESSPSGKSS